MAVQHEVEKMPFVFQCKAFFSLSKKDKGGWPPFQTVGAFLRSHRKSSGLNHFL